MIVSHKHKFIFVKAPKTAGTSVELALSTICGENDIITPDLPADEEIRESIGGLSPRNYLDKNGKNRFINHTQARFAKKRLGDDVWNSYFKFVYERNPWDRVVSTYFFLFRHRRNAPTFAEYIRGPELEYRAGWYKRMYHDLKGNVLVDKVCKYENLQADLDDCLKHLGIQPVSLPFAKSQFRKKRRYQDMYSNEDVEIVGNLFKYEIEKYGYKFE